MKRRSSQLRLSTRRVALPRELWNALDAWGEKTLATRNELLERIVGPWMAKPSLKRLKLTVTKADELAGERVGVVQRWRDIRHASKLADRPLEPALQRFLATLRGEGISISRATLFNWDAAYRQQGRAGLVDRRLLVQRSA